MQTAVLYLGMLFTLEWYLVHSGCVVYQGLQCTLGCSVSIGILHLQLVGGVGVVVGNKLAYHL